MIQKTKDLYEAFTKEDPTYPVRPDYLGIWDRFTSENMVTIPTTVTGRSALYLNLLCCFYFLMFGVIFLSISANIYEKRFNYGKECEGKQLCQITFEIEEDTLGPFFLYYELSNFYSSHYKSS